MGHSIVKKIHKGTPIRQKIICSIYWMDKVLVEYLPYSGKTNSESKYQRLHQNSAKQLDLVGLSTYNPSRS